MPQTTVIIVGAGPAGSVLAGLLARRGIDALLLDKATFPREKICGDYLSPGTVGLLDQLNLLDLVRSAGARRLLGMTIISPDGTTFTAEFPAISRINAGPPFALSIPRAILDSLLLKWARGFGARCVEGLRVTDLILENGQVCGVTGIGPTGPETYRGRIVVGADGRDSVVARRLGLYQPHPTLHRMALVAYYEGVSTLQDHGLISIGDRSYCILNSIGEWLTNAAIVVDQGIVQGWKGQLDELFDGTLQAFPLALSALRDTVRRGSVRCLGPLAFRASRSAMAGALLIGDAAGFYDPFTGEGVGHALCGAQLAASEIVSACAEGDGGLTEAHLARFDHHQRNAVRGRRRLGIALQAIIRRPRVANAVARLLCRRQSLANLLLGIIGDLLPPHALLSPPALFNVLHRT
ncbi:MAG: NAD(P)/FAD-dependent oxidoreductase [Candidatus Methylomirabilis oxygeniifera]|uniref:Putative Electron transfer oxidoreductase n=1 Tax=Methylomirabilis oxygeniifera TaxID=671143 RepID=D5MLA4_METO1|nr:MAG: NAD(P)/FAD-dependent oxidoreductase [Candidatus Methylomirabilis oxyfera]CBE67770.1 putative Electron transfer oxidoreductase [Candidatus Methylomirabilis oxyfera]